MHDDKVYDEASAVAAKDGVVDVDGPDQVDVKHHLPVSRATG
jgi:hypothetical protein